MNQCSVTLPCIVDKALLDLIYNSVQGLEIFGSSERPPSGVFMMDLSHAAPRPVELAFEGDFLTKDFNPHGMGSWITENGDYLLYIINHRRDFDVIQSFIYHPETKSLEHRKSISHPEMYNINDLVLVGEDQFYCSRDHYFKKRAAKFLEVFLRISYGSLLYIDASSKDTFVMFAANGMSYANGIAKSNNGK